MKNNHPIYQLDKTWKQIHDAPFAILRLKLPNVDRISYIDTFGISPGENAYGISILLDSDMTYLADSENGYPRSVYPYK